MFVGLALTNQHTSVLFVAPLTVWVLASLPLRDGLGRALLRLALLGVCGLLGLAPYAYLPIAAKMNPRQGSWGNVSELKGLWHHLRRGTFPLPRSVIADKADSIAR